jgi:hypothetical protein
VKSAPLLLGTAVLALALSSCGLEGERPNIWLQNNSDQTVVIPHRYRVGLVNQATAKPHTTEWSDGSPAEDRCSDNWEIVDTSGRVLKKIDKVCAYDTVVYP